MNHIPATMRGTGIGAPVRRIEDMRFLRGQGRYVDDLGGADVAQLVMLRSPYASARVMRLDVSKARGMPGVLLVLTPEDIARIEAVFPKGAATGHRYAEAARAALNR
jgi:CO/xanthine dehydrogenase Mo-binding subunit